MIDMQMRAHHEVDIADGKACRRQCAHIGVGFMSISDAAAAACRCRCSYRPEWCDALFTM